jgi:predicted ribosome quality control (RQC) complex YloA/Tae2 family protein
MSTNNSSSSSSKVRFDGLDVQAMVSYLQQTCVGRRIVNIYDGANNETYIFKLDGTSGGATTSITTAVNTNATNASANICATNHSHASDTSTNTTTKSNHNEENDSGKKLFLLLESGIRFHTISSNFTSEMKSPTPFCMKLRKHLRGLRVEVIQQIGTDRVIVFQCGVGHYKHTIILELYAKGNLIITDQHYTVIALLRSHTYNATTTTTTATTNTTTTATEDAIISRDTKNTTKNGNDQQSSKASAVLVQVGQVYPVAYATSIGTTGTNTSIGGTTTTTTMTTTMTTTTATTASTIVAEVTDPSMLNSTSSVTAPLLQEAAAIEEKTSDSVSTSTNDSKNNTGTLLNMESALEFNEWVRQYVETTMYNNNQVLTTTTKKKKKSNVITLKIVLSQNNTDTSTTSNKIINDVHHCGPALIEHCIRRAQMDPNQNLIVVKVPVSKNATTDPVSSNVLQYTTEEWQRLRSTLSKEGSRILRDIQDGTISTGYILYRPIITADQSLAAATSENSNNQRNHIIHDTTTMETFDFSNKILMEFQPVLLEQHKVLQYIQCTSFAFAVEIYFDNLSEQRNTIKALTAEKAALSKLERVRLDQQLRITSLYEQQSMYEQQAIAIQYQVENVDKALLVINSAIHSGMSWDQIEQIVHVEQVQNHNPIALLIQEIDFENDAMILRLPTPPEHDNDDTDEHTNNGGTAAKTLDVRIMLQESAYANSNRLFAQYRASKEKSVKTIEASGKAFKAAEETAKRQLIEAQKRTQRQNGSNGMTMIGKRKVGWYEKFHWFITSDNYLVIGGRDAAQNELLVKRYLRAGDAYLHADVHGASSCILRAKRRRNDSTTSNNNTANIAKATTQIVPLSDQALREAGHFTICHSAAWKSRIITSAWWVEAHQVSKTAPTGEYLTSGSFMIRGKKNFLPPTPLEMGLGVLFRLGDDESILRHQNERRDFALLNDVDDDAYDIQYGTTTTTKDSHENISDATLTAAIAISDEDAPDICDEAEIQNEVVYDDDAEDDDDELVVLEKANNQENNLIADNVECVVDVEADDATVKPEKIETEHVNALDEDNVNDENPAADVNPTSAPKRGLSVRDRKLIKKYGSLEAAEKFLASPQQDSQKNGVPEDDVDTTSVATSLPSQKQPTLKRGQKAKLKRVERKYMDQDDEDRALAMLALQGGEKEKKKMGKQSSKGKVVAVSEIQQKVAAETVALLVKDSSLVVQNLPDNVKSVLAGCIAVGGLSTDDKDKSDVPWDKFDADTLEQLLSLAPIEAQLAAANRLLTLKSSTRIDNYSASLGGIIRTIKKHGYENMESRADRSTESSRQKTNGEKDNGSKELNIELDEEGIVDVDVDKDAIDDTVEISKLTGKPLLDDVLLYAIPVCGPYQSLSQYAYRVKLTPGAMKRGRSSKQCLDILLKTPNNATVGTEKVFDLMKKVAENDWVQAICADVKISAAGASKVINQKKTNTKKSK